MIFLGMDRCGCCRILFVLCLVWPGGEIPHHEPGPEHEGGAKHIQHDALCEPDKFTHLAFTLAQYVSPPTCLHLPSLPHDRRLSQHSQAPLVAPHGWCLNAGHT